MKIGVFGGTFDPPHIGHSILADIACQELQLDHVLWVLTPDPPHKQDRHITKLEMRIKLLRAALKGDLRFRLSTIDIDRQPPYYAVDTVKLLKNENPGEELIYLMGGDSLRDLPGWHTPAEFISACDYLAVMLRPGFNVDLNHLYSILPELKTKLKFIPAPLIDISSSQIRLSVYQKKSFRYMVLPQVYKIIIDKQLYC